MQPEILRLDADISIHALREEGDAQHPDTAISPKDFYPRPPRGGRLLKVVLLSLLR